MTTTRAIVALLVAVLVQLVLAVEEFVVQGEESRGLRGVNMWLNL